MKGNYIFYFFQLVDKRYMSHFKKLVYKSVVKSFFEYLLKVLIFDPILLVAPFFNLSLK